MIVIDDKTESSHIQPSVFLHGLTGNGKSTWATKGGRPLVLIYEPKAASVLRTINPDAIGLVPQNMKNLDQLFGLLEDAEKLKSKRIDRIVLDSFTELTYVLPRWIKEASGSQNSRYIQRSMEQRDYGDLKDIALSLLKTIQMTGYPSIIIARSTSKDVGRVKRIVPDGLGHSIEELPGKLLPTVEARYDAELGYLIDSTPDDYSQRCGLPWLPQLWTGTALDFFKAIEKPVETKVETPQKEEPSEAFQDAMLRLSDTLKKTSLNASEQAKLVNSWYTRIQDLAGLEAEIAKYAAAPPVATVQSIAGEKQATKEPVSQEAEVFVDGMADGPAKKPEMLPILTPHEISELERAIDKHRLVREDVVAYLAGKNKLRGTNDLTCMDRKIYDQMMGIITTPARLHSFVATANIRVNPATAA